MKKYFFLHIILFIYSATGLFSKQAANSIWGSADFWSCYAGMLMVLFIYAIGWQQVIKRLPLSVAFANRPVVIIWSMLLGHIVFGEEITVANIIGAIIIMLGIEVYFDVEKAECNE